MADQPIDIKIGLGVDYDPAGAAAAEKDLQKVADEATNANGGGGDGATDAIKKQTAATNDLSTAQRELADTGGDVVKTNKDLAASAQDVTAAVDRQAAATNAAAQSSMTGAQQASAGAAQQAAAMQQVAAGAGQASAAMQGAAGAAAQQAGAAQQAAAGAQQQAAGAGAAAGAMQKAAGAAQQAAGAAQQQATAEQSAAGAAQQHTAAEQDAASAVQGSTLAVQDATTAATDATTATGELTTAKQDDAAASDEAAQADEALRLAMELETKSVQQLKAEMAKLLEERKKAAAAGDVAAYKKLKGQYDAAKSALGQFTQENKLGTIAMMQQAQTGLQMAGTLGGLAEKVRDGSVSFGDLAGAIIAVSMAIKAGMGPIGWLLMAIQGLQMAWDWYSDSQEEAQKAEAERVKALEEAEQQHIETLNKLAEAQRGLLLDGWKQEIDDLEQAQADANAKAERERQRAEQAATQSDQRRKTAAQAAYDQEKARLDVMVATGQISAKEAENRRRAAEDALNAELAAIDKAAIARRNSADVQAIYAAERQAEEIEQKMQDTYGKFDDVLSIKMPTVDEWKALQLKLDAGEYSVAEMQMSNNIQRQADKIQQALAEMGITIGGGPDEIIAFLEEIRKGKEAAQRQADACRETAEQHRTAAQASKEEYQTQEATAQAQRETLAAQRAVADAKQQQAAAQAEWAEVSRRSNAEQQAWLEKQIASVQEGSDLWKKYNDQLKQVRARGVAEAISGLEKEFQVTGRYAVQDNRTQSQIMQADMRILQARRARLQQLLATPDLDAATIAKANEALEATNQQIRGCRQAMQQNTNAARRWLKELQPPKLQGKSKMAQRALGNLGKQYKRAAAKAAKAAEKGDTKALERAQKQMGVYARGMSRLAKNPAAAERMHRSAMGHLKDAQGSSAQTAAAEKKAAKGAQAKAAAQQQAADAAKKQIPKGQPAKTANKVADLSAQVKDQKAQIERLTNEVKDLCGKITGLGDAAASAASAAAQASNAADRAIGRTKKEIAECRKAIERLNRK